MPQSIETRPRWQRRSLWVGAASPCVCLRPRHCSIPSHVLPSLSGCLPVLSGHCPGLDGAVDGLSPDGRKLGTVDSAHPGSRDEDPAALGCVFPADRRRHSLPLSLGAARRGGRQSETPVPAVLPLLPLISGFAQRSISSSGSAMAFLLDSWSRKEDETGNPRLGWKSLQLSGYGAVVYGISLHFAAVDWGMSLEPVFHSTIWGPLFATGQLLSPWLSRWLSWHGWSTGRLWPRWTPRRPASIWRHCC